MFKHKVDKTLHAIKKKNSKALQDYPMIKPITHKY